MARKTPGISELLKLAKERNLPEGFFDGDIEDECFCEAKEKAKSINKKGLEIQLEYLLNQGYEIGRLKELIKDA